MKRTRRADDPGPAAAITRGCRISRRRCRELQRDHGRGRGPIRVAPRDASTGSASAPRLEDATTTGCGPGLTRQPHAIGAVPSVSIPSSAGAPVPRQGSGFGGLPRAVRVVRRGRALHVLGEVGWNGRKEDCAARSQRRGAWIAAGRAANRFGLSERWYADSRSTRGGDGPFGAGIDCGASAGAGCPEEDSRAVAERRREGGSGRAHPELACRCTTRSRSACKLRHGSHARSASLVMNWPARAGGRAIGITGAFPERRFEGGPGFA